MTYTNSILLLTFPFFAHSATPNYNQICSYMIPLEFHTFPQNSGRVHADAPLDTRLEVDIQLHYAN